MTTTPYSDQWREHTRARMQALGIRRSHIVELTGLPNIAVFEALRSAHVSLEVAGPIDEALERLEARSEAHALEHGGRKTVHNDGTRHRVERVAVKLDRLTNMDGEVQP